MSGPIRLIAAREIRSRLQQKGYRIGLLVALAVVAVACVLPSLFDDDSGGPASYDVATSGTAAGFDRALPRAARALGVRVTVHPVDAAHARSGVEDGTWDAAFVGGRRLIAKKPDAAVVGVLRSAYPLALSYAGSSATPAPPTLAVTTTEAPADTQRQVLATVTVVLLFAQLMTFCTWVAMGVVEEKSSRVVELILSSVRPLQLLGGKLLGIGALATGQLLSIGIVALLAATSSGSLSVPAAAWSTLVVGFVGFVLGFAFFASLAAALGSTVSRQEEVSGVLLPVTLSLMVAYGASYVTAYAPDTSAARVLSIVPPVSALAMPGRIARGGVPTVDVVLAVALLVAAAVGIALVAARIYRASVLHSGTRVSLARAWRGEAVAAID